MYASLNDRQKEYEASYNLTLTRRLPIVIRASIRNYPRLIKNLPKPICLNFTDCFSRTMLYAASEIQGAVLGYAYHNEIVLILKNDQSLDAEAWLQNDIQKIVSVTASLLTRGFDKFSLELELNGDPIFDAKVFILPSLAEVVNYLIWRQQSCNRTAVSLASEYELSCKFGVSTANKMLNRRTVNEKIDLLLDHCSIDFEDHYPGNFKKGSATYKTPILVAGGKLRNKWTLNNDLPLFQTDKDFIYNILINGQDIFRAPGSLDDISVSSK